MKLSPIYYVSQLHIQHSIFDLSAVAYLFVCSTCGAYIRIGVHWTISNLLNMLSTFTQCRECRVYVGNE